jgi:Amt family ammonium transporter
MSSLLIGFAAGGVCYVSLNMKGKLGYDDSLDAFGVHGIGGILGSFATGIFAQKWINASGNDGLLFGNASLLYSQIVGIMVTMIYSFVLTLVILKVIDRVIGLRVDEEAEVMGLDISQHGESGYRT